jgi:type II secretory pathway predicted ATPase ExeA
VEIMTALKYFEQMHKPFDIEKDTIPKADSDPAEALAGLSQALESEKGFVLLTGPAGTGKSMLVQELLPHLTCMVCRVTIPDKEMTNRDFRQFLAGALGLESNVQSRGAFLLKIRDFLMSEAVKDRRIILVLESIQGGRRGRISDYKLILCQYSVSLPYYAT